MTQDLAGEPTARPLSSTSRLRLQLLANGYTPLPNVDKRCMVKGWPSLAVDEALVRSWDRQRNTRATGIRLERGLVFVDIDVNDANLADRAWNIIADALPPGAPLLDRRGKGFKWATLVRCDESFDRLTTRRWHAPGDAEDGPAHCVEVYGGGSPRQFGAYGPHTIGPDGAVLVEYQWAGGEGPAEVPLDQLPLMTKSEIADLVRALDQMLEAAGWTPVTRTKVGEPNGGLLRARDLTPGMVFSLHGGGTCDLEGLRLLPGGERCSASFLEGPLAKNTTRCLIGQSSDGDVCIWDAMTGITHFPKPIGPDRCDITEALQKLSEAAQAASTAPVVPEPLKLGASPAEAVAWLLKRYAVDGCNARGGVVDVYEPENRTSVRHFCDVMRPWHWTEIGPRGGERTVNPVDVWLGQKDRLTIAGVRLRPDMPWPLFEEGGRTWVNTYRAPVHDALGGDASTLLAFFDHLLPEASERAWFLDWLAYKVAEPASRGPAVVMVAPQHGTGRGTLFELIRKLLGEAYVHSAAFGNLLGNTYQAQYNDFLARSIMVCVNESLDSVDGPVFRQKKAAYEHLKELVDPRVEVKEIKVKGENNYSAKTYTSFIIATNHVDALPIPAGDRRFAVLSNGEPLLRSTCVDADALNTSIGNPADVAALYRWLLARRAAPGFGYSPFAPPPTTTALDDMVSSAESSFDRLMAEAVASFGDRPFVTEQLYVVLRKLADEDGDEELPDRWRAAAPRVRARMTCRVGSRAEDRKIKIEGRKFAVYCRTRAAAEMWSRETTDALRAAVLGNGVPPKGNILAFPGRGGPAPSP